MIKTAVILAAGLGSRLNQLSNNKPKGFLILEKAPIVELSVQKLISYGIKEILIGTGYLNEFYDSLAKKYPQIKCIYNEKYPLSGSMYTLSCLKDEIKNDFLLLESDLIYESRGLQALLNDPYQDIILASGPTNSNDEVFIEASASNYLINMSKNKKELKTIFGELTGISKISLPLFDKMHKFAGNEYKKNLKIEYETALIHTAISEKILVKRIDDFIWGEIDNKEHLKNALEIIFPKIKEKEKNEWY